MSERVQKKRRSTKTETVEEAEQEFPPQADTSETDELLDEIDDLLEEIGLDTAIDFVQKGGQ